MPQRQTQASDQVLQRYGLNHYISEIVISPGSDLVGQSLQTSQLQRQFDMDVIELIREGAHFPQPIADKRLQAGDILLVRSNSDCLLSIKAVRILRFCPRFSSVIAKLNQR